MRATDEWVREASGILAQRFSAYLGTFTCPSDVRLLVPSFELSLRSANKMAEDD
jgi:hypothetical protein